MEEGAGAGNLRNDLWLEAKAVFCDGEGLDRLALENFLAGFHVGEREELVVEGVPEIRHAVPVGADEAGAKDGVRLAP